MGRSIAYNIVLQPVVLVISGVISIAVLLRSGNLHISENVRNKQSLIIKKGLIRWLEKVFDYVIHKFIWYTLL